ncbi:lipid-transfer protein [Variovorax sp. J31P207]|uniref:lipid-transfer protein n=1 Tax=Variovorax sp. J31P207 TaxID=3053510 RepID=UPI002574D0ED|nr:lipid-transfer protein [Variovorax sp. J31P207]MDM0069976.1 lipid-transfer protein [Variovorax sp. J31P207]
MNEILSGKVAVAGIGATEFSKDSGRTEMRLAVEACLAALNDAGIEPAEVDGMCTFTMDHNPEMDVHRLIGGRDMTFFSRIDYGGGGACAPVMQAAMAIASGAANVVLCYRAMNERSWYRFGAGTPLANASTAPTFIAANHYAWYLPAALSTPASFVAMAARVYMEKYGVTSEDFGRVSVAARDFAATNPKAFFHGKPITLDDHQASRFVAEPLHLLDCCQESDGAVALVITSLERARRLRNKPAVVRAAAQASAQGQHRLTSFYRKDLAQLPEMGLIAKQLYAQSGLGPRDFQSAILYDHFTPYVLEQLEEFGFCGRGEAKDFVRSGQHASGGALPINPNGGQLGEAYIHGMNGIAEAVRQIRGSACNQISGIENVLVTAGSGVPTSGIILGRD